MTPIKYLLQTQVCTTSELLSLKRQDPAVYDTLIEWTRQQMQANGVEITEK